MSTHKSIVLIMGGNTGIGNLTARALADASPDYHIIICSRSVDKGEKALSELQSSIPKSSFSMIKLDVTDQDTIRAAVSQVEKDFGRLDVLINNAGIISGEENLLDNLRATFETNAFGPALVTEAFIPLLEKSRNGRLIYVSSGLASLTYRGSPEDPYYHVPGMPYRMSKAAMTMMMLCHHKEYKDKGIKVWAFDPGYVVTNLSGTGEAGVQERIRNGAGDASLSAKALADVVDGKRDMDVGKHVDSNGIIPW